MPEAAISRVSWLHRVVVLALVVLAVVATAGVAGFILFTRPQADRLSHADAIVVLGGEWDGRVAYGLDLARRGYADTVLLSDGYAGLGHDGDFARACAEPIPGVRVICFAPQPYTTRGEAMYTAKLAAEHQWRTVIVVSWNYHMVRARYIFRRCFDGDLIMRPVPRSYDRLRVRDWASIYWYQYAALAKAAILGCG